MKNYSGTVLLRACCWCFLIEIFVTYLELDSRIISRKIFNDFQEVVSYKVPSVSECYYFFFFLFGRESIDMKIFQILHSRYSRMPVFFLARSLSLTIIAIHSRPNLITSRLLSRSSPFIWYCHLVKRMNHCANHLDERERLKPLGSLDPLSRAEIPVPLHHDHTEQFYRDSYDRCS